MLDNFASADQVRDAAGCSFPEAQVAIYMALSSEGKTLDQFSQLAGMSRRACRDAAFRWGIQFPDFDPFAKAKRIDWRKAKKGWDLYDDDAAIGECRRLSDGKYCAKLFSSVEVENWDARRAMADLSRQIDTMSPDLPGFEGLPVLAVISTDAGLVGEVLFPIEDDGVQRCRDALQFRTVRKQAA